LYKKDIDKIKNQLNNVLSFVDPAYIEVLLTIHNTLENEQIEWALGGEIAEALQTVQVEPDCIEIVTGKEGAEKIFSVVKQYNPKTMEFQTNKLTRNAIINGIEHPIYVRSYYFDFFINCVKIKVHGDMQYKINDWDWGDKLEFTPEYVNVTGVRIAVVPLEVKQEIYKNLGWTDKLEKIEPKIKRGNRIHS
jgi:hypothetical protein